MNHWEEYLRNIKASERNYYTRLYVILFMKDTWPAWVAGIALGVYIYMFVLGGI